MKRREFLTTAFSGASVAVGSGILFPKPAISYTSLNYVLSVDVQKTKSNLIFNRFLNYSIASGSSKLLPEETDPAIKFAVGEIEHEFSDRQYVENRTPFTKVLNNVNHPIWGQQKQEKLGPNPGFGTVQVVRNRVSSIAFTGATSAGIDRAIKALAEDQKLTPAQLEGVLIPIGEKYEDWASWEGEVHPKTGELLGNRSIAQYVTRFGEVTRLYKLQEPGKEGFGEITFYINAPSIIKAILKIEVLFS